MRTVYVIDRKTDKILATEQYGMLFFDPLPNSGDEIRVGNKGTWYKGTVGLTRFYTNKHVVKIYLDNVTIER